MGGNLIIVSADAAAEQFNGREGETASLVDENNFRESKMNMKNSKQAGSFLVLAMMMLGLVGCGMKKEEPKVEIKHKIVGKWSAKALGGESVVWDFRKDGAMIFSMNGKESPAQKYRMIDDTTVELETKSGTKSKGKLEFSDNDNTMAMTDAFRIKTTFKRE